MNKILEGDCLEVMAGIPDGSVDMVLTDLPYGMTACEWDKHILDFDELWTHWNRVCRNGAPVLLFATGVFSAQCVMSNPSNYRYKWTWRKAAATGYPNANKQPMRATEDILAFYGKPPTYNPQMGVGEPRKGRQKHNTAVHLGKTGCDMYKDNHGTRFPTDVLEFPNAYMEAGYDRGARHPTQKPVNLLRYLIRTYTNPGDMVLDSTCGSGSTCVAATLEGREWIGIEKEAEYAKIARDRVERAFEYEPTGRLPGV